MSPILLPVDFREVGKRVRVLDEPIQVLSMRELGLTELDLEDFVRDNISLLFPDEDETLLIVGQQVRNEEAGRADLVALDGEGNIVLIELKRDVADSSRRYEPFEFQAIRYAANYALVSSSRELAENLFAPYIERRRAHSDFSTEPSALSPREIALRRIQSFLDENRIREETFNKRQRIILIASSFDRQTESACAWLSQNGVDIRCIAIKPIKYAAQVFFEIDQVIPPPAIEDYFVPIADVKSVGGSPRTVTRGAPRKLLPRMQALFDWDLLHPGDRLFIRGYPSEICVVVDSSIVNFREQRLSYNEWGQKVTGWSAINIYEWAILESAKKTLDVLRREKMLELENAQ